MTDITNSWQCSLWKGLDAAAESFNAWWPTGSWRLQPGRLAYFSSQGSFLCLWGWWTSGILPRKYRSFCLYLDATCLGKDTRSKMWSQGVVWCWNKGAEWSKARHSLHRSQFASCVKWRVWKDHLIAMDLLSEVWLRDVLVCWGMSWWYMFLAERKRSLYALHQRGQEWSRHWHVDPMWTLSHLLPLFRQGVWAATTSWSRLVREMKTICHRLWAELCPSKNLWCSLQPLALQNVTAFGDRFFIGMVKLKWGH